MGFRCGWGRGWLGRAVGRGREEAERACVRRRLGPWGVRIAALLAPAQAARPRAYHSPLHHVSTPRVPRRSLRLQAIPFSFNSGEDYVEWGELVATGQLASMVGTTAGTGHGRGAGQGCRPGVPARGACQVPQHARTLRQAQQVANYESIPCTPPPQVRDMPPMLWLANNAPLCEITVLPQEIEPFDYGERWREGLLGERLPMSASQAACVLGWGGALRSVPACAPACAVRSASAGHARLPAQTRPALPCLPACRRRGFPQERQRRPGGDLEQHHPSDAGGRHPAAPQDLIHLQPDGGLPGPQPGERPVAARSGRPAPCTQLAHPAAGLVC